MSPVRRLAVALVTPLVATLTISVPAAAQSTFTWNNGSANSWLTPANWSPSTNFPGLTGNSTGNNAGDTANFAAILPSGNAAGIDMSTGSNNANQLLQLGAITFSNASNGLAIGNSSNNKVGTLQMNGATVNGQIDTILSNTSGAQTLTIQNAVGAGSQTMTLSLGLTNGTAYIVGSPGATINVATVISETGGSKSLTLQGGGTTVFSGANTYTGTTLVTGNTTLHVTNTTGSATGTGMVAVASPAKLSGTGTITPTGGNDVQIGGRLQPGSDTAAGTLNVGSNTSMTGTSSVYIWSLSNSGTGSTSAPANGASDASGQSRLAVNGNLNFQPGTIDVTGLAGLSFDNTKHYNWTVATATGTITPISSQPTFTTTNLNTGGGTFTLSSGIGGVFVGFTPAPEPASILLCCGIAAGVTGYVRRKRARSCSDVNSPAI
jgi:autotransporter-associated beta strand protein